MTAGQASRTLVFLLEETSARAMLQGIVGRLLPEDMEVQYIVFEGKRHLEQNLVKSLRCWRKPCSAFIIMRDQDAGDCLAVKNRLLELARQSDRAGDCTVRIACHELCKTLRNRRTAERDHALNGLFRGHGHDARFHRNRNTS